MFWELRPAVRCEIVGETCFGRLLEDDPAAIKSAPTRQITAIAAVSGVSQGY